MTDLPNEIIQAIHIVSSYAGEENSWNKIKIELVNTVPVPLRSLFSRRDPSTRELNLNDFEKNIIQRWYDLTGIRLEVQPVEWKIRMRTGKPVGRPRKNVPTDD